MIKVNKKKCIGCGICAGTCPECYNMVNGKAEIKNVDANCCKKAIEFCPVDAITL